MTFATLKAQKNNKTYKSIYTTCPKKKHKTHPISYTSKLLKMTSPSYKPIQSLATSVLFHVRDSVSNS